MENSHHRTLALPVLLLQRQPRHWSTAGLCQSKGKLRGFPTPTPNSTEAQVNPGLNQTETVADHGTFIPPTVHTNASPSLAPKASQIGHLNLLSSSGSPTQPLAGGAVSRRDQTFLRRFSCFNLSSGGFFFSPFQPFSSPH